MESATYGGRNTAYVLDIRNFKQVNEQVSQSGGDVFLVELATRFRKALPDAFIARIGGDEFLVLARVTGLEVLVLGERIIAVAQQPVDIHGVSIRVSVAVGYATFASRTELPAAIVHASMAMQEANEMASVEPVGYDARLQAMQAARRDAENELREAVINNAIDVYFQPLVRLDDRSVHGFEALARWQHPDGRFTPPDVFIRTAEAAGLIDQLSMNLLRKACRYAKHWPATLILAFNISPQQLSDERLAEQILAVLKETGFPPKRLSIEITESALVGNLRAALTTINQLRLAGARLALDDFGTGYSSLAQLANLPFDKIKIDRQFTASFLENDKQALILRAMIRLGHVLDIATLAEGIETEAQYAALRALGCYLGQGFLFGRAMPPDKVPAFLASAASSSAGRAAPFLGTERASPPPFVTDRSGRSLDAPQ
ncbi:putative bifunctional diguanylate cyclase/phosphodiesterase [Ancylobacter sp. G4_0304]|uniref:putative bifunctional diguanylate cyclase/phosphodiesterase n=1 Tax=Ancylobacter sp. G4_0304 TaxID=3114289 RepID=UPI0039C709DD